MELLIGVNMDGLAEIAVVLWQFRQSSLSVLLVTSTIGILQKFHKYTHFCVFDTNTRLIKILLFLSFCYQILTSRPILVFVPTQEILKELKACVLNKLFRSFGDRHAEHTCYVFHQKE